ESKAAQSREHAGIEPDTRAVFAEGDVAAVVRSCLDSPMRTNCLGGADGGERFVRDVECGLRGAAQQSGRGAAGVDDTLDTDDGGNQGLPVAIIECASGIKDDDGAAFVTATRRVVAMVRAERFRGGGNLRDYLVQGRLVALDVDDQGDVGFLSDL